MRLPDFYIIGAMKCATSTLQRQLALQKGVFMSEPKEPNFFSDDDVYARGLDWYGALFADADGATRIGEASTHYAKWPTWPDAPVRLKAATPDAKFIYMIRHPIDRLISHYLHEWTMRKITIPIDEAVTRFPELFQYSLYHKQLSRWLAHFPADRFALVTQEGLKARPRENFERLARFLELDDAAWVENLPAQNVSADRLQRFPLYEFVMENRVMSVLRRALVPSGLRRRIADRLRPPERPELGTAALEHVGREIEPDLAALGRLVGRDLTLETFRVEAASGFFDIRNYRS